MDKYDIEVIEKRAFNNAIFATDYNRNSARILVKKIYSILKDSLLSQGFTFLENTISDSKTFEEDTSNYVRLVQTVDLKDENNPYSNNLISSELKFMKEYIVYGKHLISIGDIGKTELTPIVHPKNTNAYKTLCKNIIGQEEMKHTLCKLGAVFQYNRKRQELGLKASPIHKVFAFVGPPGTAKTTSSMFFAQMMKEEKILSGDRIIYVTGTQLKAKFIGQTSERVHEIFKNNDIIIIDEAYSLVNYNETERTDNFSQEALAQLCIEVEDHSNDKLIIFAGYGGDTNEKNNKMKKFLDENPGISSRITFTINFSSYSPEEMLDIFSLLAKNSSYNLEPGWEKILLPFFKERVKADNFGNGREARRLLEHAMTVSAENFIDWITYETHDKNSYQMANEELNKLTQLSCHDLKEAVDEFLYSEKVIKGRIKDSN